MEQEKVTYPELLEMHVGQTRIFTLTDKSKLYSVAACLTNLKNAGKGEWTHRKDFEACAVSVTRVR